MLFGKAERRVKRILIVEDEPLVAFDNEMMLAGAGYEVVATVDDYDDALAVIDRMVATDLDGSDPEGKAAARVDLILTDVTLAGDRSGLDLAREARKRGIPVLFATAVPPDGAETLSVGVLLKPYSNSRLKAALRAVDQMLSGKTRVRAPEGVLIYPGPPMAA